jgi:hypothetical protein
MMSARKTFLPPCEVTPTRFRMVKPACGIETITNSTAAVREYHFMRMMPSDARTMASISMEGAIMAPNTPG